MHDHIKHAIVDHIYTIDHIYNKYEFKTRHLSMDSRSPHLNIMILLVAHSRTGCLASMDRPLEAMHRSISLGVLAYVKILLMADLHLSLDLSDSFKIEDRQRRGCGGRKDEREQFFLLVFPSPKTLDLI